MNLFLSELYQLFIAGDAILGWGLFLLLTPAIAGILFALYLFRREYQQNKRERQLVEWDAALKAATAAYWAQQSPA